MALQQKETEASFVCIVFALNIIDLPKELLVRFFRNVGDAVCCYRRRTFRGLYVCLFVEHTSELCENGRTDRYAVCGCHEGAISIVTVRVL